jgi:hypothetical protein
MKVEALIELLQTLPSGTTILMYDADEKELTPVVGLDLDSGTGTAEIF